VRDISAGRCISLLFNRSSSAEVVPNHVGRDAPL